MKVMRSTLTKLHMKNKKRRRRYQKRGGVRKKKNTIWWWFKKRILRKKNKMEIRRIKKREYRRRSRKSRWKWFGNCQNSSTHLLKIWSKAQRGFPSPTWNTIIPFHLPPSQKFSNQTPKKTHKRTRKQLSLSLLTTTIFKSSLPWN